ELVALAQGCLAPEREARPRDGAAVAEAVASYQAGVQERLRATELERAAAEARAAGARAKALAGGRAGGAARGGGAGARGPVAGAGLAGLWYQSVRAERALRRGETTRAVAEALGEAQHWQEQRRLPEALSATRRAKGVLDGGLADPDLRRRVEGRLADLEL